MKRLYTGFLFLLFLWACNNSKEENGQSDSNIDAARNFIRAALDGNFREARNFMLRDSLNDNFMDVAERSFQKADPDTRNGYRAASINIHRTDEINDSTAIIIFSNSFKQDHDTLRVVKKDNRWQVDFKYLYQHDLDTSYTKPVRNDSLK